MREHCFEVGFVSVDVDEFGMSESFESEGNCFGGPACLLDDGFEGESPLIDVSEFDTLEHLY